RWRILGRTAHDLPGDRFDTLLRDAGARTIECDLRLGGRGAHRSFRVTELAIERDMRIGRTPYRGRDGRTGDLRFRDRFRNRVGPNLNGLRVRDRLGARRRPER